MVEGAPDGLMLFDGLCNLCSTSVNLALALDRRGVIRFCPIQSPYGRALALEHGLDPDDPSTFVFFDAGAPKLRSTGALALAARLSAPWRQLARVASLVPLAWRDGLYNWIAANRYRLFGRRTVCRLPTPAERARFVAELAGLPIASRVETWRLDRAGLFPRAMGDSFDALPAAVRAVHSGAAMRLEGRVVSAGRGPGAWLARLCLGLPGRGRLPATVEIAPDVASPSAVSEVWTRRFGRGRFRSRLSLLPDRPGQFEERLGPAAFAFSLRATQAGFAWVYEGWRLGPVPMPTWLGPACRGRCCERDGVYRFSAIVAHPWLGVMVAYAGRLAPLET